MTKVTIYERLLSEHKAARSMFKDTYSFKTKQDNILFTIQTKLRKELSKQVASQNIIDDLTKKMEKRQLLIDSINHKLEIAKSITEEHLLIE